MELQGRNQSVAFVEIISDAVFCTEFSNSSFLKKRRNNTIAIQMDVIQCGGARTPSLPHHPFTDELVHLSPGTPVPVVLLVL